MWHVAADWHLDDERPEGGYVNVDLRRPNLAIQIEFDRGEASRLTGLLDSVSGESRASFTATVPISAGALLGSSMFWTASPQGIALLAGHADEGWEIRIDEIPLQAIRDLVAAALNAERGI
ncbi:hypothetical protein EG850_09490 [Gulosibacter macacae]|uniref:Uncharacterized protein n=1 Tax=Gulosibacter macacae TaxID=2488791 RepID=A0A3P3VXI0_9MICO|nr:hypothetical protein [Gulosibacter macacae]RRJ86316.1 hypothetical protein EG850_09490 [Gulosibacter macacae]